jgi:uncharacterized protein (DUF1778 family)
MMDWAQEVRMSRATRKENPVSFRMQASDISIIDRAAELRGSSRTEFVRDAAVREAEAVLLQRSIVKMTASEFRRLMTTLDAPPQVVPELVKTFRRKAPWEN